MALPPALRTLDPAHGRADDAGAAARFVPKTKRARGWHPEPAEPCVQTRVRPGVSRAYWYRGACRLSTARDVTAAPKNRVRGHERA
jgi:hypothetical protein